MKTLDQHLDHVPNLKNLNEQIDLEIFYKTTVPSSLIGKFKKKL